MYLFLSNPYGFLALDISTAVGWELNITAIYLVCGSDSGLNKSILGTV